MSTTNLDQNQDGQDRRRAVRRNGRRGQRRHRCLPADSGRTRDGRDRRHIAAGLTLLPPRLGPRLEPVELLEPGGTERDLRQALNDLIDRLRYALGEDDQPPRSLTVPE